MFSAKFEKVGQMSAENDHLTTGNGRNDVEKVIPQLLRRSGEKKKEGLVVFHPDDKA